MLTTVLSEWRDENNSVRLGIELTTTATNKMTLINYTELINIYLKQNHYFQLDLSQFGQYVNLLNVNRFSLNISVLFLLKATCLLIFYCIYAIISYQPS